MAILGAETETLFRVLPRGELLRPDSQLARSA